MKGKKRIVKEFKKRFEGKEVLFLENDMGLYHSVGVAEDIMIEHKIKYHTILDISKTPLDSIIEQINFHDVIVWESQYVYDISKKLLDLVDSPLIVHPIILVECCIDKPIWYYKPDKCKHEIFIFTPTDIYEEDWEFYELGDDHKPSWEKLDNEV